MSDQISRVCFSEPEAQDDCLQAFRAARAIIRGGGRALIECRPADEPISIRMRKFLHGPVLGQISEQARVDGVRYTTDVWKEFFRKMFVPRRYVMARTPRYDPDLGRLVQPKRKTPHLIHSSTEELGNRAYAKLVDEIIQYAAHELHVDFQFSNEEQGLLRTKPTRKE